MGRKVSKDPFDLFIDSYEKGLFTEALQSLISHPSIKYDSLVSKEHIFPHLVNFADACVFKGHIEFVETVEALEILTERDPRLRIFLDNFLDLLKKEDLLFHFFVSDPSVIENSELPDNIKVFFLYLKQGDFSPQRQHDALLNSIPPIFQPLFQKKIDILKGWDTLRRAKPALAALIHDDFNKLPWHSFAYPLPLNPIDINPHAEVPLIFLEPLEKIDYDAFLKPYCQNEMILVFDTLSHLYQLLQFPDLHRFVKNPKVFIYILDLYPQEQFKAQKLHWRKSKILRPIMMVHRPHVEKILPLLTDALSQCLTQPMIAFEQDTPPANWLYQLAKKTFFHESAVRYGKDRYVALSIENEFRTWNDSHKGSPPLNADLGPPSIDYLQEIVEESQEKRNIRRCERKNKKKRIAHIVPQIVDGGHAPTRLLTSLCKLSNKKLYEMFVISTERPCLHSLSYPSTTYFSEPSTLRGKETLDLFQHLNIPTAMDLKGETYEMTVENVLNKLRELEIEIVVFHGPDELNTLIAASTEVPCRVLFEHGTLPIYHCFDRIVLSTEEAFRKNQMKFQKMGIKTCLLNFSVDVRQDWEKSPYSKKELGLPEESFVMTTISNHLDNRLSTRMCHAIGEILKRCPRAIYAPIGEATREDHWRKLFAKYGVNERIYFLGKRKFPSQYARSMDLYLNEFPFGSGLSLLEAMASGCPVVSMYEEHGPQQARYGATYFGEDHVIKSGNPEDYVNLACQLINDPKMYLKWSEYAMAQYEKRVNVKEYVRSFESFLETV